MDMTFLLRIIKTPLNVLIEVKKRFYKSSIGTLIGESGEQERGMEESRERESTLYIVICSRSFPLKSS